MKRKLMIGILIIALICISSGAYAVLSENATVSNEDAAVIADNNVPVNSDNSIEVKVSDDQNTIQNEKYQDINEDKLIYIGENAYYRQSEGVADYYIRCVECGGYLPIGEVSHSLPDNALCHGFTAELGNDYKDYAVSYDEAYNQWIEDGQPNRYDYIECHGEQGDPSLNTPWEGDIIALYDEVVE